MKIFVFGNGNLSFDDFCKYYTNTLVPFVKGEDVHFILCDFRGVDTLMMEFLKCQTSHVTVYHIGEKPRYAPDKFNTHVGKWNFIGGFKSDKERDLQAIDDSTHFLAYDFNSDSKRKSGTAISIELCHEKNKTFLGDFDLL